MHFGTDLFSEDHDELIPFRDGGFVSPTITFVGGKFYDSNTGLPLAEEQREEAKKYHEMVQYQLELSDRVVNGDLLRFYTPENFTPVDRSQYNYTNLENEEVE